MNKHKAPGQDTSVFSKAMQALLMAAFMPANFEPFLKKIAGILSGPGALGKKASVAIMLKGPAEKPVFLFQNTAAADRKEIAACRKKTFGPDRTSNFNAEIRPGGAACGRIMVRAGKEQHDPAATAGLIETAAKIIAARIDNEIRDAELAFERDLSSSVKHVEELYLSYPSISLEEISRAVLDEARRMTGSAFGFAGYIDHDSGHLVVPALTAETWPSHETPAKTVIFHKFKGLWGWVLKNKKPLLTNCAESDRHSGGVPHGHIKIKRFLGVPAMSGRRLIGMLALAASPDDYGLKDLESAQKLARVYAMVLQRKLAEEKQKEEDTKFKTIISASKDVIYTADLKGRITYISPRAADFGYTQEEVIGRQVFEFSHPEDKEFLIKAFTNAVTTGRTMPILPYRLKCKDGSHAYVEQKSGLVFIKGKPAYITGVVRDVTYQKETERRLKESEALMRMVFDTAEDPIFIKDMNGMYVKTNKACADLMKTTPNAMRGHSDSDYFPAEAAAAIFRSDSEVVRTGKTLSLNNLHPFPAGSRYVNIIKTPLKNSLGETIGLLGIARDITELKKMESELALTRAAEAVSDVARPIAHDFNNALAAINGYATLIDDDLSAASPIKTEISRIIEAVKRAAELTSKFQDFARNPDIKKRGQEKGD